MVGAGGVETVLEIPLSSAEREALLASAAQLHEVLDTLSLPGLTPALS